jgi:chromosomal replication initiation ATPase DnaA
VPKASLSIKSLREKGKKMAEAGVDFSNMPMNDYDFDDIKMQWRQFAFKMKEEGKGTFYNALIKRDPIHKEGHDYILEVDNQVQVDYINPILPDLLGHIRSNLKNYGVNITLEVTKNPEKEVKYLSGKDKFAAMARKNPNLHTLKTLFDLDIEF